MKKLLFLILSFFAVFVLEAQNISGIVNTYAAVSAISGRNFTIGTPGGKTGASLNDYNAGAVVLIYQAKGASADTTNVSSYGNINAYNSAGRYELTFVKSRSGSVVKLINVRNRYNVSGKVQLIAVPNYTDATVNATVTCSDWDNSLGYGGVVAIKSRMLRIAAGIDVSGKGFEGGGVSNDVADACNATNNTTYASSNTKFAFKGEGIIDFPSLDRGRAEIGNGGGGANPHNGGGGGGSNWASGGEGGFGWPGDGCGVTFNAGGFGGNALNVDGGKRLFFGGGGGGGQQNDGDASPGANGGGIILILTDTLRLNCPKTYAFNADGADADTSFQDGAGGGGAGGSIIINAFYYDAATCTLNVHANGGDGGDVTFPDIHGGGGGGGTGPIASNIVNSNGVDCDTCTLGSSTSDPGTEPATDSIIGVVIPGDANGFSCAPGGLSAGLLLWLRADAGVTTVSGAVSAWADQSGANHDFSQGTTGNRPQYRTSGNRLINFNPSLDFDGSNDLLEDADGEDYINGLSGITIASVLKADAIPAELAWWDAEESDGADDVISLRYDASGANAGCTRCLKTGIQTTSGSAVAESQSNLQTTRASVVTFDWEQSSSIRWFVEGASTTNTNNSAGGNGTISGSNRVIVGDGTKANWDGLIAEIVVFDERLSAADRLQLESYLALKYGINKTGNYILPDSTVIWNASLNPAYNNAVFGLGAYSGACLDMDQSQSEINSEMRVQNPSNLSSGEAIVFGHNNEAYLDGNPSDVPVGVQKRLKRLWLAQETDGDVGTLELLFDTSGFGNIDLGDIRLLIDRDGDGFGDGDVPPISGFSYEGGFLKVTGVNLQDGDFFTLGTTDRTQTPLSLDLLYFEAERVNNNEALLTWQSLEPEKWLAYDIQRSSDGKHFSSIARVQAHKASIDYSFIDKEPNAGINYYRLRSTDPSGVVNYSMIRSLEFDLEFKAAIALFPNPVKAGNVLHLTGLNQELHQVEFISAQGTQIHVKEWNEEANDLSLRIPEYLSPGLYLVKLQVGASTHVLKLVIE